MKKYELKYLIKEEVRGLLREEDEKKQLEKHYRMAINGIENNINQVKKNIEHSKKLIKMNTNKESRLNSMKTITQLHDQIKSFQKMIDYFRNLIENLG